jgi:peroxiredoxin
MKKLAFLALAFFLSSSAYAEDFLAKKQVKLGEPVADFALSDAAGSVIKLSDSKGKIVMLHFWSAKCPFVVRYEERLKKIVEDYEPKDVVIYAIDSNITESREDIKKESEKRHLNYPVLLDADQKVADQFGAITTPHVFILDKDGRLRYEGAVDDQGWGEKDPVTSSYTRQALDALLKGEEVPLAQSKTVGCTVKRKK